MSDAPFKNPGWAGNTGEFDLDEAAVRGTSFVGERATDGGHPSIAPSMPYMLTKKNPEAPLFEGEYKERFEKIRSRYPNAQAARDQHEQNQQRQYAPEDGATK